MTDNSNQQNKSIRVLGGYEASEQVEPTEEHKKNAQEILKLIGERIEEDKRQIVKEYNIQNFNDEANDSCDAIAATRRPLVLFRGKPITREQTMQLITREEPLFSEINEAEQCSCFDIRKERGTLKNLFYRPCYSWLNSWIHTDGTIGGDINCLEKYPQLDEIIPLYMHLSKYDFLDMIISYTTCEENSCSYCQLENYENRYLRINRELLQK